MCSSGRSSPNRMVWQKHVLALLLPGPFFDDNLDQVHHSQSHCKESQTLPSLFMLLLSLMPSATPIFLAPSSPVAQQLHIPPCPHT